MLGSPRTSHGEYMPRRNSHGRICAAINRKAHLLSRCLPRMVNRLHDMIGNVWERTSDWCQAKHESKQLRSCCVPHNPLGAAKEASCDANALGLKVPRKVLKRRSHLCAPTTPALSARSPLSSANRYLNLAHRFLLREAFWSDSGGSKGH